MQQRVIIAMALSSEPKLLILDEPTTNLDVTTEAAILDLIRDLIRQRNTAVLYVSHNLGVVASICDQAAVMYAGELVEDAPVADLYRRPLHPYTRGLLDSVPRLGQNKGQAPLRPIAGVIPQPDARPPGCVFAPRCPLVIDRCRHEPPALTLIESARRVRCHRWPDILAGTVSWQEASEPAVAEPRRSGWSPTSSLPSAIWRSASPYPARWEKSCVAGPRSRCAPWTASAFRSGAAGRWAWSVRAAAARRRWRGASSGWRSAAPARCICWGFRWRRAYTSAAERSCAACRWSSRTRTKP